MMPETFRGRTLKEAEASAQAALGADAEILTIRNVASTGLRRILGGTDVEVSAVKPEPEAPPVPVRAAIVPWHAPMPFARGAYADEEGQKTPVPPAPATPTVTLLRAELHRELRLVQGALSQRDPSVEAQLHALRTRMERLREPELPRNGAFGRVLGELGVEGPAATALLRACPDMTSDSGPTLTQIRATAADLVPVAPWPLANDGPMLVALVGPAGVGKTTTAAKLGANAMYGQKKSVTFICYDTFRVGATAQLERFAGLLGAQMQAVRTATELRRAIALAKTDVVIVDTAGRPPKDQGGLELLLSGDTKRPASAAFARSRHVLLCLPAALRAVDAERLARTFGLLTPTGLVITKLDETSQRAGLLHGAFATKLPVNALCFGQNVPDDIAPATRARILEFVSPRRVERQRAAS